MRINVDRLCELAGLKSKSGRLLSESVDAEDKENAEEYAEEEGIATEAVSESASFKMGSVADRFRSLM